MVYGMDALRLLVSKAGIARGEHAVDGLLVKCGGKDEPVIVGIQLHHSGGGGHGIALEGQFLYSVHISPSDGVQRINLYDYGRAFADDGVLEQGILLQRISKERIGHKTVYHKGVRGKRTAALSLSRESTARESTASESGREGKIGRESLRAAARLSFWTTAVSKGAWEKAQRHIKKATKTVQILFIVS